MKLYEMIPISEFENYDVECKAKLNKEEENVEGWAKSISAFSNSGEGHIYVGVDNDFNAFGLDRETVDSTKNLVLLTIDRHIFPHVKVFFTELPLGNGRYVLDILVPSYPEVVCFRSGDYNEKAYIRENGASVPASVSQIIALGKRKFGSDVRALDVTFERKNFTHYLSLAKRFRKDGIEPSTEDLITLEVLTKDGRVKEGLAMFADSYDSDDSLAMCRLWDGMDKGVNEAIDKKTFKGPLGDTLLGILNFIKRNSRSGFIKMSNGSRLDTHSYPDLAVREAVGNAIAHRDYSISNTQIDVDIYKDRLEISSPGSWLLSSSPENYSLLKIPSVRRNKVICGCFEAAGLMEQSASGFKKIARIYEKFPDKEPYLENNQDNFVIVLYDLLFDRDVGFVEGSKYEEKVIAFCRGISRSREEIQKHLGIQSRSYLMRKILKPMLEKGSIKRTAPAKSPNVKYIA